MKLFSYTKDGKTAVILSYNRGHACKILAKELEKFGKTLDKSDAINEIDIETEKKGRVIFLD